MPSRKTWRNRARPPLCQRRKFPLLFEAQGRKRVSRTGMPPSLASAPVRREADRGRLPKVARTSGRNQGLALSINLDWIRLIARMRPLSDFYFFTI